MIEAQQKAQLASLQKAKDDQEKKQETQASAAASDVKKDGDVDTAVSKTDIAAIEVEDDFDLDDI